MAVFGLLCSSPVMAVDLKAGKQTYDIFCAACHGKDGRHATAPDLANSDFLALTSPQLLRSMIEVGRPGRPMPGWKAMLKPDDLQNVVAYIKGWQKGPDVPLPEGTITGDLKQGATLYATTCAGCHGTHGAGGSAPALNNPGFLGVVSDGYLKKTLELGRPGTAMRSFLGPAGLANLSEQEIHHVVAYVRSWEKRR
jgi:mono/diheme cytochrome c family protein